MPTAATVEHPLPKLEPNWKEPYDVILSLEKRDYNLKDKQEKLIGRVWDTEYIKKLL